MPPMTARACSLVGRAVTATVDPPAPLASARRRRRLMTMMMRWRTTPTTGPTRWTHHCCSLGSNVHGPLNNTTPTWGQHLIDDERRRRGRTALKQQRARSSSSSSSSSSSYVSCPIIIHPPRGSTTIPRATTTTTCGSRRRDEDDGDDAARARAWEDALLNTSVDSDVEGSGTTALPSAPPRLARTVTFSTPLEYRYGEGELTSTNTSSSTAYTQRVRADLLRDVLRSSRAKCLEGLRGYDRKVVRFFKPEPTVVLLRWRAAWGGDGQAGSKTTTSVDGQTKYSVVPEGSGVTVTAVEETWDFSSTKPGSDRVSFLDALGFALAHAPPDAPAIGILPDGFMPAVKLAAWQALKDDPNYGGQLIREELDVITTQAVIAFAALCVSTALLVVEVFTIAFHSVDMHPL